VLEPGDCVEVLFFIDPKNQKEITRIGVVKDMAPPGVNQVLVEIDGENFVCYLPSCRKLSEHEVMERLEDV
jgi:hypothetical protein